MAAKSASPSGKTGTEGDGETSPEALAADIAVLREESREQLELLRTLVRLLLPKADDDGPKLEDLIAALVSQQRDILTAIRQVQSDVLAVLEHLEGDRPHDDGALHANGSGNGNGASPT
jgi:hypothetical protein